MKLKHNLICYELEAVHEWMNSFQFIFQILYDTNKLIRIEHEINGSQLQIS